jgi:hypothetical protein
VNALEYGRDYLVRVLLSLTSIFLVFSMDISTAPRRLPHSYLHASALTLFLGLGEWKEMRVEISEIIVRAGAHLLTESTIYAVRRKPRNSSALQVPRQLRSRVAGPVHVSPCQEFLLQKAGGIVVL